MFSLQDVTSSASLTAVVAAAAAKRVMSGFSDECVLAGLPTKPVVTSSPLTKSRPCACRRSSPGQPEDVMALASEQRVIGRSTMEIVVSKPHAAP